MANPGGSVKDHIALSMIEAAEQQGSLMPGRTIVEPTRGNAGTGHALVRAVKRYPVILTMPEEVSPERRKLLRSYGARVTLTPTWAGLSGAIARARSWRLITAASRRVVQQPRCAA